MGPPHGPDDAGRHRRLERVAHYTGAWDGVQGPQTTDAVKRFQADAGLNADGDPGSSTRKALFGAYRDWLCTPPGEAPPAQGKPFSMAATDFLGGEGAQPGDLPKMSLQSCGKFNPVFLLSTDEMDKTKNPMRNAQDAPNRRVLMFLLPGRNEGGRERVALPEGQRHERRLQGRVSGPMATPGGRTAARAASTRTRATPWRVASTTGSRADLPARRSRCPSIRSICRRRRITSRRNRATTRATISASRRMIRRSPPGPGRTSSPTLPGSDIMAIYVVATAVTRPTIVFDHGFLDDGNHNLHLSKMTSPTAADYAALVKWEVKLRAAQTLRPDLVDATNAYEHFLSATGHGVAVQLREVRERRRLGKTDRRADDSRRRAVGELALHLPREHRVDEVR